ncbi:thioredoxin domain-containing protein [Patescibacteria group bacterium]|nr:thioredoxin domain-containing protein [Patescibacteria group bacterium]
MAETGKPQSFLTVPNAIIIGSLIISVSILIAGGVIKIGPKATAKQADAPAPSPAAQQQAAQQPPAATLAQVKDVFTKSQIKFGDVNKKLIVVEAADPSCPFCQVAAGKNPELNKQIGSRFTLVSDGGSYVAPVPEIQKLVNDGKAAFAWIYTPGHGNGEMGTKALYCAFEKGKFWEVHDMLMNAQGYDLLNNKVKNDKSKSGDVAEFLQPVFDPTSMKQCLDSGKYDSRLTADISLAQSLGISGTPGFYFNTTQYISHNSYKDMESATKSALGN